MPNCKYFNWNTRYRAGDNVWGGCNVCAKIANRWWKVNEWMWMSEAVLVCLSRMGRWLPYSETDEFATRLSTVQRSRCIVDRGSKGEGKCLTWLISCLKCPFRPLQKDILEGNIDRVGDEECPKCLSGLTLSSETLSWGSGSADVTTNPQRHFTAKTCHHDESTQKFQWGCATTNPHTTNPHKEIRGWAPKCRWSCGCVSVGV